jgi:hypothetical protein
MHTRCRAGLLSVAVVLAAGPVVAAPAMAASQASANAAAGKAAGRPTARPAPRKPAKPTPFSVTGTLTAVDPAASTLTVLVKGGKHARGTAVTVAVAATARLHLNDRTVTLAALPVGAHAAVSGTVSGGVRTARRVNVETHGGPAPTASPTR